METIKKVLDAYSIYPATIDKITDRLYRIHDGRFVYALKQASMGTENIAKWERVYQQAFVQNLSLVLPVYVTENRKMYVEMDGDIYYLTPWIETEKKRDIELFYRSLGIMHAKTKNEQLINAGVFIRNFDIYKSFCDDTAMNLLHIVEQFEKSRYMSPFELLVCTHYRDLEYAMGEVHKRIDKLTDQEAERVSWNYSMCHGNLKFSHLLMSNQTYLLNFERAKLDNAVMDLVVFFRNEIGYFDAPSDMLIDEFSSYTSENELTDNELQLLLVHLLNPTEYITIIQDFLNKGMEKSMITAMIRLEQAYRRIIFGLKLSDYIEREYETVTFDDLES